ncbi:MAG: hypothetical protein IT310_05795 [Anaerolineales bacterium]|nr:hypothetical protein [Anaerolineales bacterium]
MRSKEIRYLGVGLGIGIAAMTLLLGSAFLIPSLRERILTQPGPASTPLAFAPLKIDSATLSPAENTSTPAVIFNAPTPTETPVSVPTLALSPTLSPAEVAAANGSLAIVGPLSREQQLNLYNAALTFVAPTYAESKKMSVAINQLRFSDPSTTCGPLSIAILQRAGILNAEITPHDFFLINPDNGLDRQRLEKTFPNGAYTNTRYKIKLNRVNWLAQPLLPGDFLYIYAGEEGNFEHMLVVTRVDSAGRAYSVTNYNTEQGFIINEVLLYDPSDPSVGIFAQWTKKKEQALGSTGFAGYELWRHN